MSETKLLLDLLLITLVIRKIQTEREREKRDIINKGDGGGAGDFLFLFLKKYV